MKSKEVCTAVFQNRVQLLEMKKRIEQIESFADDGEYEEMVLEIKVLNENVKELLQLIKVKGSN